MFPGGITCIQMGRGFIYWATSIDRYSKKVVGLSAAENMRAQVPDDASKNAAARAAIKAKAIFHPDHCSANTSAGYRALLARPSL